MLQFNKSHHYLATFVKMCIVYVCDNLKKSLNTLQNEIFTNQFSVSFDQRSRIFRVNVFAVFLLCAIFRVCLYAFLRVYNMYDDCRSNSNYMFKRALLHLLLYSTSFTSTTLFRFRVPTENCVKAITFYFDSCLLLLQTKLYHSI